MLVAIDVGNTQTHVGAFDGERLVEHWRFQTRAGATSDELADRLAGLLSLSGIERESVDAFASLRWCRRSTSSTSGSATAISAAPPASSSAPASRPGCRSASTIPRRSAPTASSTPSPPTTGSAAAASSSTSAPASTSMRSRPRASTSAARSRPGSRSRCRRWPSGRRGSPASTSASPSAPIGKSSRAAIQSGVVYGFAGLVDAMARRIAGRARRGDHVHRDRRSGHPIAPFCEMIDEVDDLLTLTGLRLIHERTPGVAWHSTEPSRSAASRSPTGSCSRRWPASAIGSSASRRAAMGPGWRSRRWSRASASTTATSARCASCSRSIPTSTPSRSSSSARIRR